MQNIDWNGLGFKYMDTRCHIRYVWRDGAWDTGELAIAQRGGLSDEGLRERRDRAPGARRRRRAALRRDRHCRPPSSSGYRVW